jgi:hypothetical protein
MNVARAQCDASVELRVVTLAQSSGLDVAMDEPPVSQGVSSPSSYVIELWAQQSDESLSGFVCVYFDISFDGAVQDCTEVDVASEFTEFGASGSCLADRVIDCGGCSFTPTTLGLAPQWVRVATVHMFMHTCVGATGIYVQQPTDPLRTTSIFGCGNVPPANIEFVDAVFNPSCCSCAYDVHCDDGLFCNGVEVCIDCGCHQINPPCDGGPCDEATDSCVVPCDNDVQCDDGAWCNGEEYCDAGDCFSEAWVCWPLFCDENNDICVECFHDGNCPGETVCLEDACVCPSDAADVNGDSMVTLDDALCVLDGFAGVFDGCDPASLDIAPPCAPDGLVDLRDIAAVLDALGGAAVCCDE